MLKQFQNSCKFFIVGFTSAFHPLGQIVKKIINLQIVAIIIKYNNANKYMLLL